MGKQSVTKISGLAVVSWQQLKKNQAKPKIFVTEKISLADVSRLSGVAAVITKDQGASSPAILKIVNSGRFYWPVNNLIINHNQLIINGFKAKAGEWLIINTKTKKLKRGRLKSKSVLPSLTGRRLPENFLCFLTDLSQLPQIKNARLGLAVRSEDLLVDNKKALSNLLGFIKNHHQPSLELFAQKHKLDYLPIFQSLRQRKIMIRLLDSALSELYPKEQSLREKNIQLGNRGCRLAVTYPAVYQYQLQAIFKAAQESNFSGELLIAVPFVSLASELALVKKMWQRQFNSRKPGCNFSGKLGFTLETPRAILILNQLIKMADFINLGFNDLTQLMYGYSRDDVNRFMPAYLKTGILKRDPFTWPDQVSWNFLNSQLKKLAKQVEIQVPVANDQHYQNWRRLLKQYPKINYLVNINLIS